MAPIPENRILIADWNGEPVGLLVDSVDDAIEVGAGDLLPPPANQHGVQMQKLLGVFRSGERLAALLDPIADPRSQRWNRSVTRTRRTEDMNLRVLVVDDAAFFRRVISDALASLPGVEVVGSAANGSLALQKIREFAARPGHARPRNAGDGWPGSSGCLTPKRQLEAEVIVVSALSRRGGELTVRALEKGAFDFITKPEASSLEQGMPGPDPGAGASRLPPSLIVWRCAQSCAAIPLPCGRLFRPRKPPLSVCRPVRTESLCACSAFRTRQA